MMKAAVRSLLAASLTLAVLSSAMPLRADDDPGASNCYSVRGEARYGALGYNHVVIITNTCDVKLECEVWTDVDPKPRIALTVEPKATGEKTTRLNSPARGFKAFGECKK
ncbi:MAG: hypothetical protein AAF500_11150 [Myxococcota bacterium]